MNITTRITSALAIGLCFLSPAGPAHADFIGYLATTEGGTSCYNPGVNEASPISISSSCSGSKTHGNGTLDYVGAFKARADYSGLGAYAEWSQDINATEISGTTSTVFAQAGIRDSLLVSGGSGSGILWLPIDVSGTDSSFGGATSYGALASSGPGYFVTGAGSVFYVEGPGEYTLEIPFEFGVAVALGLDLGATIFGIGNSEGDFSGGISDYFSSADFLPFKVFDSNGDIVADASVFSTSGFQYPVGGAIGVPEPSTLALLGAGLAGAIAMRRRKKKAA